MPLMQETIAWDMESGMETEEYRSIEEHMGNIRTHLRVNKGAKESLTVQYQKKRWLDIGESPDAKKLVDKVLERILSDASQYDIFIAMLKTVVGMDIIRKNIEETYKKMKDEHSSQSNPKKKLKRRKDEHSSKTNPKKRPKVEKAKEPKPRDLMRLVTTDEPIKLGRELCVKDSDLDIVKKNHPTDHSKQLSDVLSLYMKQSVKPSWEEVATALWNIGEKRIAQKIADKYGFTLQSSDSESGEENSSGDDIPSDEDDPDYDAEGSIKDDGSRPRPKPGPQFQFHLHDQKKRGLAVLVTCDYKGTPDELSGTDRDAQEMRKTLEQFNYDIIQLQNEQATKDAVTALVKQLSLYMRQYTGATHNGDGRVKAIIFAFAGHGMDRNRIIANDGKELALREIVEPLVKRERIGDTCDEIPKLFLIDACRGRKLLRVREMSDVTNINGNFRMDYATIEGYVVSDEHTWMSPLARMLRNPSMCDETYQNVVAEVNKEVYKKGKRQRPQVVDQLNVGTFGLYYKE